MNPLEVARQIADCFDEDALPYAVGGALALIAWGLPRLTRDVDISVFVPPAELSRVIDSLERAGVMVDREDAARAIERIAMFTARRGSTIVDVFIGEHPHFLQTQQRRREVPTTTGRSLWMLSPEDLAIFKLMFGRPKDVADLEWLFAAQPNLDRLYIREWLAKMAKPDDRRFALLDDLEKRFSANA